MRIKLIHATRMAEAMAKVRAELGADAVILSTRRVDGGVEVTAASEPDEPVFIEPEPQPAFLGGHGATPDAFSFHNVPELLARRLSTGPLDRTISQTFAFAPLPSGAPRPLLLVGPPGAGKTVTCAKLAARMVMSNAGSPMVITADGVKAGASEQLGAFTKLLRLTLVVASHPATVAKALQRRGSGPKGLQPALIDTPGCDPMDPEQAESLKTLAAMAEADMVVVLPAGLDPSEASDMAAAFAAIGARHIVPTRLDVARRLGGVLAAAAAGGLAFCDAGTGPGVADGLTPMTPDDLARRLATKPEQRRQQERPR